MLPSILAISADSEIKKLTTYAGEYESGNINYVQFLVYTSSARENMNQLLGATGKEMGGILKEDQLKSILGEPTEKTRWVWQEGAEKEKKMDKDVPVWRKIVFDGEKIQVRLTAWPSIFSRKNIQKDKENNDKNQLIEDLEGKLIYRLNFETEFKKSGEQLDIQSKIEAIKSLAQTFGSNPSPENAEALAKESVNAEKSFQSYFQQSGEKCEEFMGSIFGTENKRRTQNMYVVEAPICEGDNYEIIARIEMCDDCENNWINMDIRVEGRGPGFNFKDEGMKEQPSENSGNKDSSQYQQEISEVIDEIKQACNNKDFNSIMKVKSKLWSLNEAWNQKSNDVWKDLDKEFNSRTQSMSQEERQKFDQNYGWIKLEQEKRQKAKTLTKLNYEVRKQFYLGLFSDYDITESYFTQIEFEKRLIEEFREKGEEICNNNQDDNNNNAIDCSDEQCGGKICGKGTSTIQNGNETTQQEVNFYCIEQECKAREEVQEVVRNVSFACQELSVTECEEGSKAFFSKYDPQTNCPLETKCLKEEESCTATEDCIQPSCGVAECIEGKCKITSLTECKESECSEGEEKICELIGSVVEICHLGFWQKTGECSQEVEVKTEITVGNECVVVSDCGGENVCSNGKCELLPNVVISETAQPSIIVEQPIQTSTTEITRLEETIETQQTEQTQETEIQKQQTESTSAEETNAETQSELTTEESTSSEQPLTANVIFNSILSFFSRLGINGRAITGFDTEEPQTAVESTSTSSESTSTEQSIGETQTAESTSTGETQQEYHEDVQGKEEDERRDDDERRNEENERRNEENKERCKKECTRPCVEKCIKEDCGEQLTCTVEDTQKKCETECSPEESCVEKCSKGGDWWKEFENKDENKQEKGVFQVGGSCRTNQGKTEGFIWFGGWGEPFQEIQYLKNKYYSGGQADWCKYDYESLKKQREEFEAGFNQEFVTWFFEKYLANSAENWEQASSGIFELYWKDVDNAREMAYRMQCLGTNEISNINLINVKYESDYGSIEFWEEIKTVKLEGMNKEVQIITPYMKAWIFPNKEFIKYEMQKSMKNHEFPGSPEEKTERKNEEGLTPEEKENIRQNTGLINKIQSIALKYNGNVDVAVRLMDNDQVVFNLYVQVNEKDIFNVKPMLPEEVPEEDVRVDIEFQKIYDLIYMQEKEMSGERLETPPWDKKIQPIQKIKEFAKGIQMSFKVRSIINSAKISPEASSGDVKSLVNSFFQIMMSEDNKDKEQEIQNQEDETTNSETSSMIGNVIFG